MARFGRRGSTCGSNVPIITELGKTSSFLFFYESTKEYHNFRHTYLSTIPPLPREISPVYNMWNPARAGSLSTYVGMSVNSVLKVGRFPRALPVSSNFSAGQTISAHRIYFQPTGGGVVGNGPALPHSSTFSAGLSSWRDSYIEGVFVCINLELQFSNCTMLYLVYSYSCISWMDCLVLDCCMLSLKIACTASVSEDV